MPIRFSLIGCGKIGARHAAIMQKYGILESVCDIDKGRADLFSEKYEAKAFYDMSELIRSALKTDVIAICTPNGLHARHSIMALSAGMNVLCEKPMAISSKDCIEMMDAAEAAGKILLIVKQNRFNPRLQSLKKAIDDGRLGKIYSFQLNCFWSRKPEYYADSWHGTLILDGGTLFTQFSHFIDLLYWLFGEMKSSNGLLANYGNQGIIEFEDTGLVILQFKNGTSGVVNYTVNSHDINMEGSITVFGEKGTVKVGGAYFDKLEYQNIENFELEDNPEVGEANNYGSYSGSMSNHEKVYENLMGFLENNEAIYMNAREGMKTVEIIEHIYKNAKWTL